MRGNSTSLSIQHATSCRQVTNASETKENWHSFNKNLTSHQIRGHMLGLIWENGNGNKMEQYVAIRNATKLNKRRQWIFRTKANSAQMSPDKVHHKTCHNLHHIECALRVTHKEDCNVTSQFTLQTSTAKDWVIFRRQNLELHKYQDIRCL